jgi:hypothetical protein
MIVAVGFSEALFALIAGLAFVALLVGLVWLLVAFAAAVIGELGEIFRPASCAPARETASAPSVSRALSELGVELDRVAWEWPWTSTAGADQAPAVRSIAAAKGAMWTPA